MSGFDSLESCRSVVPALPLPVARRHPGAEIREHIGCALGYGGGGALCLLASHVCCTSSMRLPGAMYSSRMTAGSALLQLGVVGESDRCPAWMWHCVVSTSSDGSFARRYPSTQRRRVSSSGTVGWYLREIPPRRPMSSRARQGFALRTEGHASALAISQIVTLPRVADCNADMRGTRPHEDSPAPVSTPATDGL